MTKFSDRKNCNNSDLTKTVPTQQKSRLENPVKIAPPKPDWRSASRVNKNIRDFRSSRQFDREQNLLIEGFFFVWIHFQKTKNRLTYSNNLKFICTHEWGVEIICYASRHLVCSKVFSLNYNDNNNDHHIINNTSNLSIENHLKYKNEQTCVKLWALHCQPLCGFIRSAQSRCVMSLSGKFVF